MSNKNNFQAFSEVRAKILAKAIFEGRLTLKELGVYSSYYYEHNHKGWELCAGGAGDYYAMASWGSSPQEIEVDGGDNVEMPKYWCFMPHLVEALAQYELELSSEGEWGHEKLVLTNHRAEREAQQEVEEDGLYMRYGDEGGFRSFRAA